MNISIDGDGNVSVDTTFDTSNIDIISNKMQTILNTIKVFDSTEITAMVNTINLLYPQLPNFEIFLEEWERILNEVVL